MYKYVRFSENDIYYNYQDKCKVIEVQPALILGLKKL